MSRTEDDLRLAYRTPPDIDDAEARLLTRLERGEFSSAPSHRMSRVAWITASASAAAVAGLAASIAVLAGSSHDKPAPRIPLGGGDASTTASPSPTATPHEPAVAVTPQSAVQTLRTLLAPFGSTSSYGGQAFPGLADGQLVLNDGHGAALFTIQLSHPYRDPNGTIEKLRPGSLCDAATMAPTEQCHTRRDGSQVDVFIGPHEPGKPVSWTATVLRKDSVEIQLSESNAAGESGPTTRTRPPLTIKHLIALADSSRWSGTTSAAAARADAELFSPSPPMTAPNPNLTTHASK